MSRRSSGARKGRMVESMRLIDADALSSKIKKLKSLNADCGARMVLNVPEVNDDDDGTGDQTVD